jgi:hypothetical protein
MPLIGERKLEVLVAEEWIRTRDEVSIATDGAL